MQKIIFLDVDGTLVNDYGEVPTSAVQAVQEARKNGHLVFLSTGRSKAELFPEILNVGFDGIIGAAGGYIEIGEQVFFHEHVSEEDLRHLVNFFTEHGIDYFLESNVGLFAGGDMKARLGRIVEEMIAESPNAREAIERGIKPFHDALREEEELVRPDINKISFLGSEIPFNVIQTELESRFNVIPSTVEAFGENSGELSIPGINKATAIAKLLEHLKIDREHTFAYGDGMNDFEMLEFVACGVAMGNAKPALKGIADDITGHPNEDGIYNSFKKYELI